MAHAHQVDSVTGFGGFGDGFGGFGFGDDGLGDGFGDGFGDRRTNPHRFALRIGWNLRGQGRPQEPARPDLNSTRQASLIFPTREIQPHGCMRLLALA